MRMLAQVSVEPEICYVHTALMCQHKVPGNVSQLSREGPEHCPGVV